MLSSNSSVVENSASVSGPPRADPPAARPPASSSAAPGVVQASGLRKTFGRTVAVEELDLCVPQGEIFGLVGPDGAGKTTTFRLLIGLLTADAGEVRLGGYDVRRQPQQARALLGYVAQNFTLYGDLTVAENLRFVAQVRGLDRAAYQDRLQELLRLTGLAPFPNRLARDLSGGMKRKLALACALIHQPRILLLDEPTTGVDPVSRREFWRMLYGLPAGGVTLVVSTPYLDEAERCHRLGFMAGGRLLAVDTPRGLLGRMPDALVEICTTERTRARRLLKERPEVRRVETMGGSLRVAVAPDAGGESGCRALAESLKAAGIFVVSCRPVEATLSDVFSALADAPTRGT